MQNAALLWHVSLLVPPDRKGLALGVVGLVRVVPIVFFSLVSGVVADAWDRRKLMLLSAQLYGGIDLRERARPHLRALAERTGVTANLGVRDGTEIVYVDKIEGRAAVQLRSFIGWRGPLYCTALGKAVLAFDGEEVRHALWRSELKRLTPHTITDRAALERELAQIRAQGYAVDEREHEAEVRCIAAPVFNHFGELVGAISVSGTVNQLTRPMVPEIGQLVRDRAEQISRSLGHGGGN